MKEETQRYFEPISSDLGTDLWIGRQDIAYFICSVMVIPISSADVERTISDYNVRCAFWATATQYSRFAFFEKGLMFDMARINKMVIISPDDHRIAD